MIQCEVQEFVEDIAHLGPEPCQELPASAMDAEHPGIEIMNRKASRLLQEKRQPGCGIPVALVAVGRATYSTLLT